MKKSIKQILSLVTVGLLSASVASAFPFAPAGTDGSLPADSFGGSGIPTGDVMLSTYGNLTLGLSAHERYVGSLSYDNAGTFSSPTGTTLPDGVDSIPNGKWNFNFYINNPLNPLTGDLGLAGYTYKLTLASDAQTISSSLITFIPDNSPSGSLTTAGNSENPGFDFLGFTTYDPNANADYAVSLEAFSTNDVSQTTPLARAAINIRVGTGSPSVPDSGSTLALMGLAFAGIAGLRRKFNA